MNNRFDELTKSLAQSVTRRAAFKRFGVGLAGLALACFGLAARAHSGSPPFQCNCKDGYPFGCQTYPPGSQNFNACLSYCTSKCSTKGGHHGRGGPY
jgi:hypothetical protein